MFERYTEGARRSLFFAQYEASSFGASHIESEHLLVGVLREHRLLDVSLIYAIRKEIEERTPRLQSVSTNLSVSHDQRLSRETKMALAYASEEARRLNHQHINTGHLMLGLLGAEGLAGELLRKHGVELESMRARITDVEEPSRPSQPPAPEPERTPQIAPAIEPLFTRLREMVTAAEHHLAYFNERDAHRPKGIERKEALGHLIDRAAAHYLWLGGALNGAKPAGAVEPPREWSGALRFAGSRWSKLVKNWAALNGLILDVMASAPEEKADAALTAGINAYIDYTEEHLARILTRG